MSAKSTKENLLYRRILFHCAGGRRFARRWDLSVTVCSRRIISPVSSPKGPLAWEVFWSLANLRCPFCWFQNYMSIFQDESFRESLGRTFLFLIICLPCELVLGLVIALLLHAQGNELMKKIGRVALVIPMATTFAVVGLMGRLMFDANYGIINYLWSLIFVPVLELAG